MHEVKPINIPLIVFTILVTVVGSIMSEMTEPRYYSNLEALATVSVALLLSPIAVLWIRALWNTVVPRITSWREITFWEAAGVLAIASFFIG